MFSKVKVPQSGATGVSLERRQAKIEKRRRFWKKARKGLFWTLAVAFVAHLSLNIYASIQLNRELAAIRQKGEPLRFSEIEPPAVPDAQNAWLVYEQATKSLRFSPGEKLALRVSQRNLTPADKKLIESAIRNNQKAIALTRQAATMPQCRFPLNWQGNPLKFRFPHYARLRELARLLALDARIKARQGDRTTALNDVRALFGISHHLSKEPVLIGFLVAQSVDALAHQALGQTLDSIPQSVVQARALEASLPQDDWASAFHYSMVGERTFGLFGFESLGQSGLEDADEDNSMPLPVWTQYPLLWIARPVLKLDEVQTLRMWRQMLDSPESQQVPQSVTVGKMQNDAIQNAPFYAVLTKILFPVFSRVGDNRDFAEVRRRQREVALALTCFRTARGHYPAQLQEVVALWGNSLPLDPYSQKPFVYRASGKSFVLYSIGVNRVNDGGKNARSIPYNPSVDDMPWLN
ncbi:hypothetical protein IAD21_01352 [Abditibacteriota bacterium]|nr:hypothetical protein IAD21_01352 [Abditibacteriota bacterium]